MLKGWFPGHWSHQIAQCYYGYDPESLLEAIRDKDLRSISFDLHCTLVTPAIKLEEHIYAAFRKVLLQRGCHGTLDTLEKFYGERAAGIVANLSDRFYVSVTEDMDAPSREFADSVRRWRLANMDVLYRLIANAAMGDVEHDIYSYDLYEDPEVNELPNITRADLECMATEVQTCISGSSAAHWKAGEIEKELVSEAFRRGLDVFIWSNGTQASVEDCITAYFPMIPLKNVFTPRRLDGTGKPSWQASALFWFNVHLARIPTGLNETEWELKRNEATKYLSGRLRHHVPAEKQVKKALRRWCRMYADERVTLSPNFSHLHVGNSGYHDDVFDIGRRAIFWRGTYEANS